VCLNTWNPSRSMPARSAALRRPKSHFLSCRVRPCGFGKTSSECVGELPRNSAVAAERWVTLGRFPLGVETTPRQMARSTKILRSLRSICLHSRASNSPTRRPVLQRGGSSSANTASRHSRDGRCSATSSLRAGVALRPSRVHDDHLRRSASRRRAHDRSAARRVQPTSLRIPAVRS
jgi:hypothetical protein